MEVIYVFLFGFMLRIVIEILKKPYKKFMDNIKQEMMNEEYSSHRYD